MKLQFTVLAGSLSLSLFSLSQTCIAYNVWYTVVQDHLGGGDPDQPDASAVLEAPLFQTHSHSFSASSSFPSAVSQESQPASSTFLLSPTGGFTSDRQYNSFSSLSPSSTSSISGVGALSSHVSHPSTPSLTSPFTSSSSNPLSPGDGQYQDNWLSGPPSLPSTPQIYVNNQHRMLMGDGSGYGSSDRSSGSRMFFI
jgi:hypothetical protein